MQAAILNASDLERPMWKRISTSFEIQACGISGGILGLVSQREPIKPSCRPRARAGPVIRAERHSKTLGRSTKLSAPVKESQAARTTYYKARVKRLRSPKHSLSGDDVMVKCTGPEVPAP